jgi:hypothetical protein
MHCKKGLIMRKLIHTKLHTCGSCRMALYSRAGVTLAACLSTNKFAPYCIASVTNSLQKYLPKHQFYITRPQLRTFVLFHSRARPMQK